VQQEQHNHTGCCRRLEACSRISCACSTRSRSSRLPPCSGRLWRPDICAAGHTHTATHTVTAACTRPNALTDPYANAPSNTQKYTQNTHIETATQPQPQPQGGTDISNQNTYGTHDTDADHTYTDKQTTNVCYTHTHMSHGMYNLSCSHNDTHTHIHIHTPPLSSSSSGKRPPIRGAAGAGAVRRTDRNILPSTASV
jgi:hypothetical protein